MTSFACSRSEAFMSGCYGLRRMKLRATKICKINVNNKILDENYCSQILIGSDVGDAYIIHNTHLCDLIHR
ncbi:hypothetical protein NECAME_04741 [Necator americanus]|uniref:Uncharacterized protein n=1 Tax=Necator americanus TaxID=51031 RepID=W2SQ83_NECAM|nr:hypothetical protein NECAME_04741 [Necator americanus]ETN71046.1 hypothetical protein NECAME_04741 [Necator americanus]